ncbi:pentatricopeptide repeat-containing protein At1g61870, mitochondrial [Phalaenopsis equestris]|uniref:pentatricopeptide repeat-containing protein At1g61870, mitochondrial n=1 Tax=Phalaenopsis equestris TaxID=78828 RepID=UPI0009E19191|nr:pentatricopeptide repeat-containing protein At1g61870, mitochondrial [Phalaenopsis equestris]
MALCAKLRHQHLHSRLLVRHLSAASPSAILSPSDPSALLTAKQKSRAALYLLRSENEPSRIVDICRAAALTPTSHLDRNAFSSAISKLSSSQSFSSIRTLIDDLLLSSKNPNPRFLSHAIVLFGHAGMLDDALRAFRSLPSPRSLNALLFACIISNNHSELAKIFREYPTIYGVTPDLETYNTVIKSFAESGTTRSFYSVFDEMLKRKIKPNMTTFCNALEGFYKEQRFDDVEKVLELMKRHDCNPGLSTYNVRILGLTKLGKSAQAKELFGEMVKKKVKPSWVTYSHLIVGFCKEGNLEEASRLYKSMRSNGCVAESWVYFALMNHLCKGGDFGAALGVCKDTMVRNWVPCFASMKMLVNGLASSSKVDEAKDLIEKVKEKFPKGVDMWKEVEEGLLK